MAEVSRDRNARRQASILARLYERPGLRILGYAALGVVPVWFGLAVWAPSAASTFFWRLALVPFWVVLVIVGGYYAHLVIRRFQLSLGAFIVLMMVWGHVSGAVWVSAGWEMGVTMFLGLGTLLCFGVTWGQAAARLCGVKRPVVRGGFTILGTLLPLSFPGLAVAVVVTAFGFELPGAGYVALGLSGAALSVVVMVTAAVVWWRARRAAQRTVEGA